MSHPAYFFAAALMLAPFGAAAQGAIAFDPESGRAASYSGTGSMARNEREALSQCGERGCRIVARATRSDCVALATSGRGRPWAVAQGNGTADAERRAFQACRSKGGVNCEAAASTCW